MSKHTFHVAGMHCRACVILTENELAAVPGVTSARANLASCSMVVEGDFETQDTASLAALLSAPLKPHGYELMEKTPTSVSGSAWRDFKWAIPFALVFILVFLGLQKLGLVNLVSGGNVSLGTAFVIGVIASLSTCMAVVGGLVLSMSASLAKQGQTVKPQAVFHLSRLVSFFLLGGLVGLAGAGFQLRGSWLLAVNLLVALVLLVLGVNLLDVWAGAKRFQLTLPMSLGRRLHKLSGISHWLGPVALGAATFFLPCGFTQSMQLYALSTGSFTTGAGVMLAFAVGTFPVLALLSFSALGVFKKGRSGVFYKTAGLVVIFFAMLNVLSALALSGYIQPVFNF